MTELIANTEDASAEKHVPVIKVDGQRVIVEIGSEPHPMIPEHYITWVYIKTAKALSVRNCHPGMSQGWNLF